MFSTWIQKILILILFYLKIPQKHFMNLDKLFFNFKISFNHFKNKKFNQIKKQL